MRVCTRPTFRSQLCARPEVQCAESPFLSVHLCITYACNVLCATFCVQRTACNVLRATYCVQSICALPVGASRQNHRRVQEIFMDACLHNFALSRFTTILILSATGCLLQPCCQLETHMTVSPYLSSGICSTITYYYPLCSHRFHKLGSVTQ